MDEKRQRELPPLDPPLTPPYVTSEERRRWDLARAIAEALFEDEAGTDPVAVWMATRSIFRNPIETGE